MYGTSHPNHHDLFGNLGPDRAALPYVVAPRIKGTPVEELLDGLARFQNDPLGFVMWAFPWGEAGTSLEDELGPEEWQREQLIRIGKRLQHNPDLGAVIEEDVASGHGIGKSAEVSWLILWAISTFEDTRGVVTANTEGQLKTKTWAELGKWYQMFIARGLFTFTATSIYIKDDPDREKTWRIDMIPWTREKSEAFAGLHNKGKRVLLLFDEAAAIDDLIYEVSEGALTDAQTQIIWLRYGNPTRTSGRFFKNCTEYGQMALVGEPVVEGHKNKRNTYVRVDSRSVRFTNKSQLKAWVDEYGEDSDFVRVRVKGMFPRAGFANFISPELVMAAQRRKHMESVYKSHQKVMAVDPARFGDDFSVITLRQGLRVLWQLSLSGFDGPDLAGRVVELCRSEGPQVSCVVYDAIGNGADLDSMLRRASTLNRGMTLPLLIAVQWGQPAKDDKQYFNQRSECWGAMRDWLANGQIPNDSEPGGLADQLTSLDYGYDGRMRIQLQSKKDIKKNGGKSPDKADSLALSFIPELIDRKITIAKVRPVKRRSVVWSR